MQLDQIKDDEALMEFLGFFHTTSGIVQRKQPIDNSFPEEEAWGVNIHHLSGEEFVSMADDEPVNTFMLKEINGMRKGHSRYLIRSDLELQRILSTMPHHSYGYPVFRGVEERMTEDRWSVVEVGFGQHQSEIVRGLFTGEFEEALNAFVTLSSEALAEHYLQITSKAYMRRGVHLDRINSTSLSALSKALTDYNEKRAAIVADHREVMWTVHHANELALKRTGSTFSYMRYEDGEPASRARPMKTISNMLQRTRPMAGADTSIWRTVNDEKPAPYAIYNTDYEVWMLV